MAPCNGLPATTGLSPQGDDVSTSSSGTTWHESKNYHAPSASRADAASSPGSCCCMDVPARTRSKQLHRMGISTPRLAALGRPPALPWAACRSKPACRGVGPHPVRRAARIAARGLWPAAPALQRCAQQASTDAPSGHASLPACGRRAHWQRWQLRHCHPSRQPPLRRAYLQAGRHS